MNFHKLTDSELEALPADTVIDEEHGTTFADEDLREVCRDFSNDDWHDCWAEAGEAEKRRIMLAWIEPLPFVR